MNRKEKGTLCALILLTGTLAAMATGWQSGLFRLSNAGDPFDKSRVATVRIAMAERDWQSMKNNARAKQYMRGDFWFDGKRYPNVAVRAKGMSSLVSVADGRSKRLPPSFAKKPGTPRRRVQVGKSCAIASSTEAPLARVGRDASSAPILSARSAS